MAVALRRVTIASELGDGDGRLVFQHERLIAVISRLGDAHDELAGHWYVEAGFGDVIPLHPPTFDTLDSFSVWMSEVLATAAQGI